MYDYLKGRLVETRADEVVVEAAGIGYRLSVSGATASRLVVGSDVTLWVHDVVRDERPVLFGFASREERRLFRSLIGVNKVGPATALSLLSALEPSALATAVDAGDHATLARVKGVGKRTAERLCVDLKGRLDVGLALPGRIADQSVSVASALAALGYPRPAAQRAAEQVCAEDDGAPTSLEDQVKRALARLTRSQGRDAASSA